MAISKPPVSENTVKPTAKVSEKKVQDYINKGGATTQKAKSISIAEEGKTKSYKLIMTETEVDAIKELRSKRPSRRKKIPISVLDWVIEAVHEKIERDGKKYGLDIKVT